VKLKPELRNTLFQYHNTLQELLRHYWSSIPIKSLAAARKVIGDIDDELIPLWEMLLRSRHHSSGCAGNDARGGRDKTLEAAGQQQAVYIRSQGMPALMGNVRCMHRGFRDGACFDHFSFTSTRGVIRVFSTSAQFFTVLQHSADKALKHYEAQKNDSGSKIAASLAADM
jgi:hypothetical protein